MNCWWLGRSLYYTLLCILVDRDISPSQQKLWLSAYKHYTETHNVNGILDKVAYKHDNYIDQDVYFFYTGCL